MAPFFFATLVAALPLVNAANYGLIKSYEGSSFFNGWNFYDHFDNLTNGDTVFVSQSVGTSAKLAYVDSTTNHAIIKVDNTSTVPWNEKRNSVRITTAAGYGVGSVWIADMYHIPYGCSVWPAWWSQDWSQAASWPAGGEIDVIEGINLVQKNQMGLHTLPGCTITGAVQDSTSVTASSDCSSSTNNNEGCKVNSGSTASYGAGFAAAGGGVYVTEFAQSGISIWFFTRANIPSSISSGSKNIDTSTFGTPTANWPSTNCAMDKYFGSQNLIFDITLCGDFAGNPNFFNQTCSGVCYTDYVVGNGSAYANAYFEVASVRVYGVNGQNTASGGSGNSSTGSSGSNSGSNSGSGGTKGNGAFVAAPLSFKLISSSLALGGLAMLVSSLS